MEAKEILEQVAREVANCEKCELHLSRKKSVPGEGPPNAEILLIGEGPGFYENEQGRPFVGPSGQFLDELLRSAGLKRADVFICNVVKCRPPSNRDPQPGELAACRPYLERQLEAISPIVIVTLGRYSMGHFLTNARISSIHGRPSWVNGRLIVPMYHPAAALHQPSLRKDIEADFANLPKMIIMARQKLADDQSSKAPVKLSEPSAPFIVEQLSLIGNDTQPEEKPESPQKEEPKQLSLF
ncbi:MAG TPA: uracil-DNA glycosylase [Anaerolineaceae bacterium]